MEPRHTIYRPEDLLTHGRVGCRRDVGSLGPDEVRTAITEAQRPTQIYGPNAFDDTSLKLSFHSEPPAGATS